MATKDIDITEITKQVSAFDPSYDAIVALEEKVQPWVTFLSDIEGSEIGDFISGVFQPISRISSAQEFGLAFFLLEYLRQYFLEHKDSDWWAECVRMRDDDRERDIVAFKAEFIPEHLKWSYEERQAALPDLTE